jgi:hypothetical protein
VTISVRCRLASIGLLVSVPLGCATHSSGSSRGSADHVALVGGTVYRAPDEAPILLRRTEHGTGRESSQLLRLPS